MRGVQNVFFRRIIKGGKLIDEKQGERYGGNRKEINKLMKELQYPFDAAYILKKKKALKRGLLSENRDFLEIRVAILGGGYNE